jgi:hypothetical protein
MTAYRAGARARTTVSRARLGKLTFLARGRSGLVFRGERLHLPEDPALLAYKEFTTDRANQVTAVVDFRDELGPADRADLDRCTAWPRALVEDDDGDICGFLMPLIPAPFFGRQADPESGRLTARPREMSWLAAGEAQRTAAAPDLPGADLAARLTLLAQLAGAIGWLHDRGWVFGDLSLARAVFAVDPPRLMLTGCDGAAAAADLRREQASAPWWDPPECPIAPWPGQRPARQDAATDAYKLGLAVLRCLTPGPGAASTRSAGRLAGTLDPAGADLVARALSADRGLRPAARDWHGYLSRAAEARQALAQPVTVSLGDLARPVVPALEAVHLESAGIPAVSVPDLPAMPHPHVLDLVEKLMPDRPAVVSLPRVDDVIAQSSRAVAGTVRDESDRYLATLRRAGLGGGNDQAHG